MQFGMSEQYHVSSIIMHTFFSLNVALKFVCVTVWL